MSNFVSLQAAETKTEQDRWFQIEVIVFKSNRSEGLFAESWNDKTELTKPSNLIDFLQPYQEKKFPHSQVLDEATNDQIARSENEHNVAQVNNEKSVGGSPNNSTTLSAEATDTTQLSSQLLPLGIDEIPFKTLSKDQLQLSNEAKSLTRHPDYQVLFHKAWRQPVLGFKQAEHVRIAGGQDFSEEFKYDGTKKIFNEQYPEFNSKDSFSTAAAEQFNTQTDETEVNNSQSIDDSSLQPSNTETIKFGNLIPELVPSPWVPELDGDIKVYLSRYLHIRTNLYLRRPDKEEVEVIDLNMFNNDMLSIQNDEDRSIQVTDSALEGFDSFKTDEVDLTADDKQTSTDTIYNFNQSLANTELQPPQKSQFSWEIDDNFLEAESEKMYIERLFNYPISQSRRVRSGELHFFDHPLMGVLILISPYEIEKDESEVNQLLSPSM